MDKETSERFEVIERKLNEIYEIIIGFKFLILLIKGVGIIAVAYAAVTKAIQSYWPN